MISKTATVAYFTPRAHVQEEYAKVLDESSIDVIYIENTKSFEHIFQWAYFPLDWYKKYITEEIDNMIYKFSECLFDGLVHPGFTKVAREIKQYLIVKDTYTEAQKIRFYNSIYFPAPWFAMN